MFVYLFFSMVLPTVVCFVFVVVCFVLFSDFNLLFCSEGMKKVLFISSGLTSVVNSEKKIRSITKAAVIFFQSKERTEGRL